MGDPAKSLRIVLIWQVCTTLVLSLMGGWLGGVHGGVSALLGGLVAVAGGVTYLLMAPPQGLKLQAQSADMAWSSLSRMLKAEGAKVAVIVVLLWLVLANYKEVVVSGFIGTFVIAVIIFSMAVFLRNPAQLETPEAGEHHVN